MCCCAESCCARGVHFSPIPAEVALSVMNATRRVKRLLPCRVTAHNAPDFLSTPADTHGCRRTALGHERTTALQQLGGGPHRRRAVAERGPCSRTWRGRPQSAEGQVGRPGASLSDRGRRRMRTTPPPRASGGPRSVADRHRVRASCPTCGGATCSVPKSAKRWGEVDRTSTTCDSGPSSSTTSRPRCSAHFTATTSRCSSNYVSAVHF